MLLKRGDIVCFKRVYDITLLDLIKDNNESYSKYMMIIQTVSNYSDKTACQVLCGTGEINWVSSSRLELVFRNDEK